MGNDFYIRRDILLKYKGSEKDVIIPDGVTAIDEKALRGCETLESVVIPDTVISIRWGAFSFCKNITKKVAFAVFFYQLAYPRGKLILAACIPSIPYVKHNDPLFNTYINIIVS